MQESGCWCDQPRGLHPLVPIVGVEPTRPKALVPKTSVSAVPPDRLGDLRVAIDLLRGVLVSTLLFSARRLEVVSVLGVEPRSLWF